MKKPEKKATHGIVKNRVKNYVKEMAKKNPRESVRTFKMVLKKVVIDSKRGIVIVEAPKNHPAILDRKTL